MHEVNKIRHEEKKFSKRRQNMEFYKVKDYKKKVRMNGIGNMIDDIHRMNMYGDTENNKSLIEEIASNIGGKDKFSTDLQFMFDTLRLDSDLFVHKFRKQDNFKPDDNA